MKTPLPLLAVLIAVLLSGSAWAAETTIAVIGNPGSPIKNLSLPQIMSLYTGRQDSAFDSFSAVPLDQPNGSELRAEFYRSITGQSETQINAFWARLAFSGRAIPPRPMMDSAAVIKRVASDPHAIGYVEKETVTKDVVVICDIKIKN
jgi:ABC-type phosphate transport system substrate-binding protein